jgi:integrase
VLFAFAQSRGYLPKGAREADELVRMKEPPKPIGIFKPEQMQMLLMHADEKLIPFLTIGAFAGLRHAEILRLDWSEVDLESGHIELKANKAKTASRRLVPIPGNLKAWLKDRHQQTGKVVPQPQITASVSALAKSAKIKWPHNALRHSYISYRVAEIQNVAQVALEAGNSLNIIFSNYRELAKAADAKKWFAITPEAIAELKAKHQQEQAEKILQMPVQVAA